MITKELLYTVCFEQMIPKWHSMPDTFPDFLQVYSQEEKCFNEKFMQELRRMQKDLPQNPSEEQKKEIKRKMNELLEEEKILHIREHFSKELLEEFEENIETFIEKVKAFDETLSMESIWQAMRNYLIYGMIVNLQGKSQNCHDPILGYSLLYPYTDNYIDELHRNNTDKNSYNNLIRKTLLMEEVTPKDRYEEKTKQLLLLVLDFYANDILKQRAVSQSLLLMLEAQEKSIYQIHRVGTKVISAEEILHISAYKGGISVFLDYLFAIDFDVASITEEERFFYLCFGLILQLSDDLQDIVEDKKKHARTLMTVCKNKKDREATVNRLLQFTYHCMMEFHPKNPKLHTFMLQNCLLLILIAVVQNRKYFSKEYIKKIENYLPMAMQQLTFE